MYQLLLLLLMILLGAPLTSVPPQEGARFEGMHVFITLNENPTTGYMWSIAIEPEGLLVCEKDHYRPDAASRHTAGGGGYRQFVLLADGPGVADIRLTRTGPAGLADREIIYQVHVGETGVESVERLEVPESTEQYP